MPRSSRRVRPPCGFDLLEIRELLSASSGRLLAEAHVKPQRLNTSNIVYTTDAPSPQRLDVRVPGGQAPAGGWPVVLAIHGGGWRQGDKTTYESEVDSTLLAAGFAVVAPDYTLSKPGHSTWPVNLDELRQAVVWVKNNAARYNFNAAEVAAMGESAGAHLALMLGTDHAGVKTEVNAVVDFYGPTDLAAMEENPAAAGASAIVQLLGGTPAQLPAEYADASPVTHVSTQTPPILIAQGTSDLVVPYSQSVELDQLLTADGVPNQFITVPGAPHGFDLDVDGINLAPAVVNFLRQSLEG